jgi:hypothetical protein
MVLVEGVTDLKGRLLIPAGKELTERYLESLPMWGVTTIDVEGDDTGAEESGVESAEPWAVEKATEFVEEHFQLSNPSHPVIAALMSICTQRRAVEVQKEGQP